MIEIVKEHALSESLSILYNEDGTAQLIKMMPSLKKKGQFIPVYINLEAKEMDALKSELAPSYPAGRKKRNRKLVTLVKKHHVG
jgi:hypothetical protein